MNGWYPGRCPPGCVAACPGSQAAICPSQTARQLLRPGANLCSSAKGVTSHPPLTLSPIHSQLGEYIEQEGWEDQARVKKKEVRKMESGHRVFITKNWQKYVLCLLAPVKWKIQVRQVITDHTELTRLRLRLMVIFIKD